MIPQDLGKVAGAATTEVEQIEVPPGRPAVKNPRGPVVQFPVEHVVLVQDHVVGGPGLEERGYGLHRAEILPTRCFQVSPEAPGCGARWDSGFGIGWGASSRQVYGSHDLPRPPMNLLRPSPSRLLVRLGSLLALSLLGLGAAGHAEEEAFHCRWCTASGQRLAAGRAASGSVPQYTPSREIDILHLAIDVTPDFKTRTVDGVTTVRFKPIAIPLKELRLDAEAMRIDSVTATDPVARWIYDDHQVTVVFDRPVPPDHEVTVTLRHHAEPTQGLYFRTPEMGYPEGDAHLWTQGEAIEARHWFPCYDAPNEKFTSEVTCRVPEGMVVRSNGRQVSSTPEAGTGRVAVTWAQEKPHVSYLICLVAGHLRAVEDRYRDIPLAFWTPASRIQYAPSSFQDTRSMMGFFEKELGVPFPWAKYDQIAVDDFVAGGMENTSITVLTDRTLFPAESAPVRSSRGLVAHELAHQWFGDLVTCRDWSHLWLNEGFATYYDALQARDQLGQDEFQLAMLERARAVLGTTDSTPIVWRGYTQPMDQFGYRAYPKGSWVLHMIRSQLGEDLYRRAITTYLQRHALGVVETSDLQRVLEEVSGRSWDRFFDQWLYHGHHPELQIDQSWDDQTRLAKVTVRQVQKLSDQVPLFQFPLPVRFVTAQGVVDQTLEVAGQSQDFHIPLPAPPDRVRIDPDQTVLAKITFDPPEAMLRRQLQDTNDVVGRILAVEAFGRRQSRAAVEALKEALNSDPVHAVRTESAQALRSIHSDGAFEALSASLDQPDPRVRIAVLNALGGFHREQVAVLAESRLRNETHPDVRVAAIRLLGHPARTGGGLELISWLGTNSFRQQIAGAVLGVLRDREDPAVVPDLLKFFQERGASLPTDVQGTGVSTLAWLARNETDKSAVRDYLVSQVNDARPQLRRAVLGALGTLGDPRAVPVLETFARASRSSPEQRTASSALERLRNERRPAVEFEELRREVLDLQRSERELKERVETLRKTWDAKMTSPATPSPAFGKKARR